MLDGRWCLSGLLAFAACDDDPPPEMGIATADPTADEPQPDPVARTVLARNEGDTPVLVNTYPGFRVSEGGRALPRWTCAAECGVCDFGECGCAPNSVSEILPGESLELQWSGIYWEELDGCDDVCADRRVAGEGTFTLTVEFGTESLDHGGCGGELLVGDVHTVSVDFEHPGDGMVEVVLPSG